MIGKKSTGHVSPLFLLLLVVGFFFVTYNMITLIMHNKGAFSGSVTDSLEPLERPDRALVIPKEKMGSPNMRFHVAVTATDVPYIKWQCRIMYYWVKRVRSLPGSDMGGFTRVLHSGTGDDLMEEIPTFVVDPLPQGLDMGYVVLNRPWAFIQWLERATIDEEYIMMAEPDHVFVNPLPNLALGDSPAAYKFFYINPDEHEKVVRKYYPVENGPLTNIDPIGNSPVIIKKPLLEKIAPTWLNLSLNMKSDQETDKAFGWVLEMYAYAVASALHGVKHTLYEEFMVQPPWDLEVKNTFIIHYTYGLDYSYMGELTFGKTGNWSFNKRAYLKGPLPRNVSLPPPGVPESVVRLVKMLNEATADIPDWDKEQVVNNARV